MILMRGQFVGPLQAVSLGNRVVTQVKSTRSLGVEIDSDLNWNVHVKELIKSSSDFYFLAHDCFHNFLSVPVMKLLTKYECNSKLVNK